MTLINKTTHAVQWQDGAEENWLGEDWVEVPPELEKTARACGGCCEITLDGEGKLAGLTPTERPAPPPAEPSQAERDRADIDFLLAMAGVTE